MKTIINLRYIILGVVLSIFLGCVSETSEIKNGVYIDEAAPANRSNQQVESITIESDMIQRITVRLADYVDVDVKVTLGIDEKFLDSYNTANGTKYEVLPDEYMSFERTVVIPAGKILAQSLDINIKLFSTPNGEAYAIPIKIVSVEGPVEAIGNATRILYLLSPPHIQKAPVLKSANGNSKVNFQSNIPLPTWTFEYWLRLNAHTPGANNTQVFSGNMSPITFNQGNEISEIYMRFWPQGALEEGPCFQCQLKGTYFDSTEFWTADTWYHIAYTYDGNTMRLYVNGEEDANKTVSTEYEFSNLQLCTNLTWTNTVQFAQIRLWNSSLPKSTIGDTMKRAVPSDSPGLMGYWKCDEGEGNTLHDSSASGNDLTVKGNFEWSQEYNFSRPNE